MIAGENDAGREKQMLSDTLTDMQREQQAAMEMSALIDSLKNTISSLRREIDALRNTVSEHKVNVAADL